nr:MAG TPA: Protein involved in gliding motility 9 Secretion System Type.5A [Bacteriophage sp.]
MKKILLFVIALCTLLVSCNQKTLPSEQPKHSESATQAATRITNIHAEYMSLEDAIRGASDIVKAKCVNKIDNPTCIEYEFSVTERFAGDQTSENIFVKIQKNEIIYISDGSNIVNKVISYAPGCTSYETGLKYYLLLTKWVSVYYDHDEYLLPINSPFIPASDITKSTVYGEPIEKHSEIKLPTSEGELCDYIKDIVSKREPPIGATMNVHENISVKPICPRLSENRRP